MSDKNNYPFTQKLKIILYRSQKTNNTRFSSRWHLENRKKLMFFTQIFH